MKATEAVIASLFSLIFVVPAVREIINERERRAEERRIAARRREKRREMLTAQGTYGNQNKPEFSALYFGRRRRRRRSSRRSSRPRRSRRV